MTLHKTSSQIKNLKETYLTLRTEMANLGNQKLSLEISVLKSILNCKLPISTVTFEKMRPSNIFKDFETPLVLQKVPPLPNLGDFTNEVSEPDMLDKLLPGWQIRYQKKLQNAHTRFEEYEIKYAKFMKDREIKLAPFHEKYEKEKQEFETEVKKRNEDINNFIADYNTGNPDAVCFLIKETLNASQYPQEFPHKFRAVYLQKSKELVIDYELPNKDIVPIIGEYRYVKTKDAIEEKPRKKTEISEIYSEVISSICLRSIAETFETDQKNIIQMVAFNGFVHTIDPATGKDIRPYLISIRTSREKFTEINLNKIDKRACLRNLGAQVSPQPSEMQPIKPVVDFNMVDKRFVEESKIFQI